MGICFTVGSLLLAHYQNEVMNTEGSSTGLAAQLPNTITQD